MYHCSILHFLHSLTYLFPSYFKRFVTVYEANTMHKTKLILNRKGINCFTFQNHSYSVANIVLFCRFGSPIEERNGDEIKT